MKYVNDFLILCVEVLCTLVVFGFFASIIWTIARTGFPALSWQMVSELPGGGYYLGKDGGILNAIVGSLIIVVFATVIGLIISIPIVFFLISTSSVAAGWPMPFVSPTMCSTAFRRLSMAHLPSR